MIMHHATHQCSSYLLFLNAIVIKYPTNHWFLFSTQKLVINNAHCSRSYKRFKLKQMCGSNSSVQRLRSYLTDPSNAEKYVSAIKKFISGLQHRVAKCNDNNWWALFEFHLDRSIVCDLSCSLSLIFVINFMLALNKFAQQNSLFYDASGTQKKLVTAREAEERVHILIQSHQIQSK